MHRKGKGKGKGKAKAEAEQGRGAEGARPRATSAGRQASLLGLEDNQPQPVGLFGEE